MDWSWREVRMRTFNWQLSNWIHQVFGQASKSQPMLSMLPAWSQLQPKLYWSGGIVDVIIPRGSQSLINFVRGKCKSPRWSTPESRPFVAYVWEWDGRIWPKPKRLSSCSNPPTKRLQLPWTAWLFRKVNWRIWMKFDSNPIRKKSGESLCWCWFFWSFGSKS